MNELLVCVFYQVFYHKAHASAHWRLVNDILACLLPMLFSSARCREAGGH